MVLDTLEVKRQDSHSTIATKKFFDVKVKKKIRITSRKTCASDEALETANTVFLQPWKAATIFSAGIT